MVKKNIFLFVFAGCAIYLSAQEVIGASGGVLSGSTGSVSYTVGNVEYTVTNAGKNRATSGVQQYHYEITTVTSLPDMENIVLSIYPNPTQDNIQLKTQKLVGATYILFSLDGKVLAKKQIIGDNISIDLSDKESGAYLLKVVLQNKELKTYKIIKK